VSPIKETALFKKKTFLYGQHLWLAISESSGMEWDLFPIPEYNIRNPQLIGINLDLVNSIPFWGQFHQHSKRCLCYYAHRSQKRKTTLLAWLSFLVLSRSVGAKAAQRTLMKLTTGLNFINVLHTAFTLIAPKSVRIQSSCQYLFTLLGSTIVKAIVKSRTLMKLTPEGSQVKCESFQKIFPQIWLVRIWQNRISCK